MTIAAIVAALLISACGPLSPEKYRELMGNPTPGAQVPNRQTQTWIRNLQYNATGINDLHYWVDYQKDSDAFQIRVIRVKDIYVTKTVTLVRDQDSALHDLMISVFSEKSAPSSSIDCGTCSTRVRLELTRPNGTVLVYLNPSLLQVPPGGTTQVNFFEALNRFILNRI